MSGEKESKSWFYILLEAAREAGFSSKINMNHLHVYSKAIREGLERRTFPTAAEVSSNEAPSASVALDEIEAVLGEHKSAFSRVVEISIKNRIDLVRSALQADNGKLAGMISRRLQERALRAVKDGI
jgi:hypothetical protein